MSSSVWLGALVIFAGLTAAANLMYQRVRDTEREAVADTKEQTRDAAALKRDSDRDLAALTREQERSRALAVQARAVLRPELAANATLVKGIQDDLKVPTNVPLRRFQSSAWMVVSAGELVRGFEGDELSQLAAVYEVTIRANATMERLAEFSIGIGAAMGGAAETRKSYRANLESILAKLGPALDELVGKYK